MLTHIYQDRIRLFNRDMRLYLLVWALVPFAYFGIQGVLLNLYLLRLGFGPEFIGLLIGSGQLIWALFALPAGVIGTRCGVRGAFVAGLLLSSLGSGLFLLVEQLPTGLQPSWLITSWMVMWLGAALTTVNSIPFVMGKTKEPGRVFAAQAGLEALMGFAGSLLASFLPGLLATGMETSLTEAAPYGRALWLAPILYLLAAAALLPAQPLGEIAQEAESGDDFAPPARLFVFLGLFVFLLSAGDGTMLGFLNVYLDVGLHVPTSRIGLVMGAGRLLPVTAVVLAPLVLQRLGSESALSWAAMGTSLGLLVVAAFPGWLAAAGGFLGIRAMSALADPAKKVLSQKAVARRWRGTTSAILTIGLALGWAASAAAGGFVITAAGFSTLFVSGAALSLFATLLMVGCGRGWWEQQLGGGGRRIGESAPASASLKRSVDEVHEGGSHHQIESRRSSVESV